MTFPKHSFLLLWCQLRLRSWSWSSCLWEQQSYSWGDRREMSLSDHSPASLSSGSRSGQGAGPGLKSSSTALLHLEHRQILLKVQTEKKASIRKSTIHLISRSNLEIVQLWLGKTWNESDTNHLSAQGGHSQVGKAERHPGRQCLCCNKKGEKFWGAEKMGLLILPGKENKKSFRDLVALEQGLEG